MTTPMRLTDAQWVNIINSHKGFMGYSREQAIALAVTATINKLNETYEGKLKENTSEV